MKITRDFLVQNLADSGLMSADDASSLCESLSSLSGPADSDTVAQELSGTDKLTAYQAECVCRGETSGLMFGDYVVLEKIGQGGMGVVLKAQHTRMERIVAVKKLTAAALESEDLVKRFYREVKASARLLHPNVVTALDAREHEGVHYLIMEFIEGEDLADVLKRQGPLPVDEAVDYVVQAAQGLEFAHEHGVFHRDIKPANLLLDQKGTVKILDMGLARIVSEAKGNDAGGDQLTSDDQVMGTCDYMAPEQAEDTKGVDHRADIYSLGCTLYRLLTNQPPYTGANLMQLLLAHRESPIPSICDVRPDVPASVDAVFQKMMAKTRDGRYQSMTEVIEALQAALGRGSAPAAAPAPDPGLMDFLKQIHDEPSGVSRGGRGSGKTDDAQAAVTVQEKADPITDETVDSVATADTDPSTATRQPSTPAARPHRPAARRKPKQTPMLLLIGVGIGISLIGAAVVAAVLYVQTDHGTVVVKTDDKDIQVLVKRGGQVHVADAKNRWRIEVKSGKYSVELKEGNDRFVLDKDTITVTRGDEVRVRVELKPRVVATGRGPPDPTKGTDAKQPDGTPVTGYSEVTDPEGNLKGDATRRFLDITKASVERKDGQYILTVVTAAPFPEPKEFGEGRRMRFQWIIHFDQPEQLGQWPKGNFCLIGISCAGGRADGTQSGWWASLSPNKDFTGTMQKVISRQQGLEVKSNTVSFAFAESELPEGPFAWWVSSDTNYSKDWLPNTSNPPTPRGMFVPSASAAAPVGESPPTGVDAAVPSTASLDDLPPWQLPPDAPKPAIAPFDAVQAKEHQEAWADYLKLPVERDFDLPGGEKLTMRLIPPGEFLMGSSDEAQARLLKEAKGDGQAKQRIPGEGPQHHVRITKPFCLGKYEVTQVQWEAVMEDNPSQFKDPMNPVEMVSREDVQPFLAKLNAASASEEMKFALPTEAQWEYACRAGTTTFRHDGDTEESLRESGWFNANSGRKTHPVGRWKANAWGLYDMHGNVWEWCADCYGADYYAQSPMNDPSGVPTSSRRVSRGGSWYSRAWYCRSANRNGHLPGSRAHNLGLRLALVLAGK